MKDFSFSTNMLFAVFGFTLLIHSPCLGEVPTPAAGNRILPLVEVSAFGTIPAPKKVEIQPQLVDSATTVDKAANRKQMLELLGVKLSKEQEKFINTNKFLIIPKSATRYKGTVSFPGAEPLQWDEMLGMHDEVCGGLNPWDRKPENAHLITPDLVLHAFHKYLENSLEYIERTDLASAVTEFSADVREQAVDAGSKASGAASERLKVIAAQFTIPCVILENAMWSIPHGLDDDGKPIETADDKDTAAEALKIFEKYKKDFPAELAGKVAKELTLLYAAEGLARSPLFGEYSKDESIEADYSQFRPRSHYAKSSALRAYFRAMIFLGRNSWLFETEKGMGDAALLAWVMAGNGRAGKPILENWKRVMDVTSFFAGAPDDVGYPQWSALLNEVSGKAGLSPYQVLQPEFLKKLADPVAKLAPPRILSDLVFSPDMPQTAKDELLSKTKGFRVFGQRFSFDAWVLGRLTAGQEQTGPRLPSSPSGVFISAVFGDPTARKLTGETLKLDERGFDPDAIKAFFGRLDEVVSDISKVKDSEWFSSLSAAWLKVIGNLTGTWGKGYPAYMTSALFPLRQIESFLGSFTELKHDMLLYAKPNYAEYGDGGEDEKIPPVVKGFVEPNLRFWYEIQRLVDFYDSGIRENKILNSETEEYSRIGTLKKLVDLYTTIAEKELKGVAVTEDEYETLRTKKLSGIARQYEEMILEEDQLRAGLIADIHTDAVKNTVLYQATGEPAFMLVLVGNEKSPRLTVGPVYNHYEFSEPAGKRLSDEDWREMAYKNPQKLPSKPTYYKELLVP